MDKSFGTYKVFKTVNNDFVGLAKLEVKEANLNEAELGFMILPEFWGQGLGSEIARVLLNKAKMSNKLSRVFAIIDPNNIASRNILIKNKFISDVVREFDGLPGEILSKNM